MTTNEQLELALLRKIVKALIAYFRVKKSWDNTLRELVILKALLVDYSNEFENT